MATLTKVLSGIGMLILVFLFLDNKNATVSIVNALGTNSIKGIKALQGR